MKTTLSQRLCDYAFYLFIGSLYAFALSRAVFDATILVLPNSRLFLYCAGFLVLFYALFYNRITTLAVTGAVVLAGLGAWYVLSRPDFEAEWYLSLRAYLNELYRFARTQQGYREEYDRVIGIAVSGVISLATALNLKARFSFYTLTILGFVVVALPIYLEWGESEPAVLILIFCFVVLFTKRMNLFALPREAGRKPNNAVFSLMAIPVGLAVAAAAWMLPKPDMTGGEPSSMSNSSPQPLLDMADSLLGNIGPNHTVAYTEEGGRLGGPHTPAAGQVILEAHTAARPYLTGSVRDTYTGSSWVTGVRGQEAVEEEAAGRFATSEYPSDLRQTQDYHLRFYGQSRRQVEIRVESRTRTLFAPPFRESLRFAEEGYAVQMNRCGALTADKALPKSNEYQQDFIDWDLGNRYIVGLLQDAGAPDEAEQAALERYLALPVDLPERVRALAREIAGGDSGHYDKMRSLESYLAQFPYTLEPDDVPRNIDFVDYFLFEGREGYCVYFASALAVLARCEGIPTRYVEGFVLPQEQNADGGYTVTGAQAHAWVEAWFPGFGWVSFEATPPSYATRYGEEPSPPEEATATAEPDTDTETAVPTPAPEETTAPTGPEATDETGGQAPGKETPSGGGWLALLLLLALTGAGLAYVRAARAGARRRAVTLAALEPREAAEVWFARLLAAAGGCGYPRNRGETAHAWAQRVGGDLPLPEGVTAEELADTFARAAYSRSPVSSEDVRRLEDCTRFLLERLRQTKSGRLRYYRDRFLLGRY